MPAWAAEIGNEGMTWSADLENLRGPAKYVLVPGGDVVVSGGCEYDIFHLCRAVRMAVIFVCHPSFLAICIWFMLLDNTTNRSIRSF